jgi:Fis family transcriptional regulator, factor for inversion stimulation protein
VTPRALLLGDSPPSLQRACAACGLAVVRARSAAEGRALLGRGRYELVDGRIARPLPLEEEIQQRLDLFYERLRGHPASGLYQAVLREVERPLVAGALARARGVRAAAAQALGIDRGTLARRIRALGLGR